IIFASLQPSSQNETSAKLALRASAMQPYVGQIVQLRLEMDLPTGQPTEPFKLEIPWLMREFGFVWKTAPEQWLQQLFAKSEGVPVQVNGRPQPIRLPSRPSGNRQRCELAWSIVIQDSDPTMRGRIEFAPVRLQTSQGAVTSNQLRLEVRKAPLP